MVSERRELIHAATAFSGAGEVDEVKRRRHLTSSCAILVNPQRISSMQSRNNKVDARSTVRSASTLILQRNPEDTAISTAVPQRNGEARSSIPINPQRILDLEQSAAAVVYFYFKYVQRAIAVADHPIARTSPAAEEGVHSSHRLNQMEQSSNSAIAVVSFHPKFRREKERSIAGIGAEDTALKSRRTSLIFAYAKSGDMEDAVELFEKMPFKDMVAWTTVVTSLAQNGKPMEAIEFFCKMQNAGVQTDEVILSGVISACAQLDSSEHADWVRGVVERLGFGRADHVVVGSALIDMYSKYGSVKDAYNVFEKMRDKNVFSYSSMILGFAMHGHANSALNLFEQMLRTNLKPNDVIFLGILLVCSYSGLVEQAKWYFDLMEEKYGVELAVKLEQALELISNMPIKSNGGVWGAMLGACRIHGDPDVAEVAANHPFELELDGIGKLCYDVFGSVVSLEDIASAYCKAGRDPSIAGDIICNLQASTSTTSSFENTEKSDTLHNDVEEFLFKMLGDVFSLNMSTIQNVVGQCGVEFMMKDDASC